MMKKDSHTPKLRKERADTTMRMLVVLHFHTLFVFLQTTHTNKRRCLPYKALYNKRLEWKYPYAQKFHS